MRVLLVALAGLLAPGFAQALMRQRRAAWIAFGAMAFAVGLLAFTVWATVLAILVFVATAADAVRRYRRLRGSIRPPVDAPEDAPAIGRRYRKPPGDSRWSLPDALVLFGAAIGAQIALRTFVIEAFKSPSTSMNPTLQIGDHFFINKLSRSPSRGDLITFRHPCEPDRDYIKRVIAVGGDTVEIRCSVLYLNGKAVPRELVDRNCTYEDYDDGFGGREPMWFTKECSRYREAIDGHSFEIFHERDRPDRDAKPDGDPDSKDFPIDAIRSCRDQGYGTRSVATEQPEGKHVVTAEEGDPCKPHMHFVVPDGTVFTLGDNRANSNDSRYWGVVPVSNIKGRVTGIWYPPSRFGSVN